MRQTTERRMGFAAICEVGARCWTEWKKQPREPHEINVFVEDWLADDVAGNHENQPAWDHEPYAVEANAVLSFVGGASGILARLLEPLKGNVESQDEWRQNDRGDAFMDRKGRIWYAGSPDLRARLPRDPLEDKEIPDIFHHPDVARKISYAAHREAKQQLEDERIDSAKQLQFT